jgi:hypothetical protein
MTRLDFDPDLERLGEALRASTTIDLAREEQEARPSGAGPGRPADPVVPTRARRPRRRVLAGSTLGLAGVGAALVLVLSAGGAAAPPAFAITTNGDGSVLVNLKFYSAESIPAVNRKLTAMGIHEQILITWQASGPAPVSGPVACTPWRGATLPGPPVKVLLGTDGTQVVGAGVSAGNTGEGTYHVTNCFLIQTGSAVSGNSGNSGNTGAG